MSAQDVEKQYGHMYPTPAEWLKWLPSILGMTPGDAYAYFFTAQAYDLGGGQFVHLTPWQMQLYLTGAGPMNGKIVGQDQLEADRMRKQQQAAEQEKKQVEQRIKDREAADQAQADYLKLEQARVANMQPEQQAQYWTDRDWMEQQQQQKMYYANKQTPTGGGQSSGIVPDGSPPPDKTKPAPAPSKSGTTKPQTSPNQPVRQDAPSSNVTTPGGMFIGPAGGVGATPNQDPDRFR